MMITKKLIGRPLWAIGVAAVLLTSAACEDSPTVTYLTEDQPLINLGFDPMESITLPSAELAADFVLDVNLSVPDALGRGRAPLANYVAIETPNFGSPLGFDIGSGFRNSSQDPRLPALVESAAASGGFWGLFNPAFTGVAPGAWDLFGSVTGLEPDTVYTVVLARMALDQRGALDHLEVLTTGEAPAEPDSLYYLGGTPASYPDVTCNFTAATGVTAAMNPVVLGSVVTDADGAATVDCVPFATGDSPWWRSDASPTPPGAADSIPFGISSLDGELRPGQYNYILLFEGDVTTVDPIPERPATVRIQMGPDVDGTGAIIDNAYAPFPAGRLAASEFDDAPGLDVYPGRIEIAVDDLPAADPAHYQVWLANIVTGERIPAVGDLEVVAGGTDTTAIGEQATWTGGENLSATFSVTDATLGNARVRDFTHIGISVEGGDASGEFAFWTEYADHNGTPEDFSDNSYIAPATLQLGRFNPDDIEDSPEFIVSGNIGARIYRDTLLVFSEGSELAPTGFEYHVWLMHSDSTGTTSANAAPLELDADGDGLLRIPASAVGGSIDSWETALITLEPTAADPAEPGSARLFLSENWVELFPEMFGPEAGS